MRCNKREEIFQGILLFAQRRRRLVDGALDWLDKGRSLRGRTILISVNCPGCVSTSIVPPCCFTMMSWLIERPRPVPSPDGFVVKIVREPNATMQPAPQDMQLMSKHRVLSFKPYLRLEWQGQDGQNETEQPDHSASLGDSITSSTRMKFSVHTGKRWSVW
jgi:hypothetical protein